MAFRNLRLECCAAFYDGAEDLSRAQAARLAPGSAPGTLNIYLKLATVQDPRTSASANWRHEDRIGTANQVSTAASLKRFNGWLRCDACAIFRFLQSLTFSNRLQELPGRQIQPIVFCGAL